MKTENHLVAAHNSKAVVLSFIQALNEEDFDLARTLLADDMHFKGVMGERDGADVYIADMKKMKLKYDIQKNFVDHDEVCLWYNIQMQNNDILSCGWYKLEAEKIKSFQVIFDPRPLLA
jgi:hypothetical protein